jgi:hypothetical protein
VVVVLIFLHEVGGHDPICISKLRRSLWIILNATFTGSLAGEKSALYYLFFIIIYVQLSSLKQMPMVWFLPPKFLLFVYLFICAKKRILDQC